jgi:uncharacterized OB-fold protein
MEEKKLFGRFCPKCGAVYQTYEIAKVNLGPRVQINMSCDNNHKWSEFYNLDYQGYWWDGKMYDSYGEEKKKET